MLYGRVSVRRKDSFIIRLLRDLSKNKIIYFMALPVIAYYLIFDYGPMYGASIAFKDFSAIKGISGSPWVGFQNFSDFFKDVYFVRIFRNTLLLSLYNIIFGFPAPIILALLLNEVRKQIFKRFVQSVTYLPHFISVMVLCGLIVDFTSRNGIINDLLAFMGMERVTMLLKPELFRSIYVGSNIWQELGWGSIIYLAALAGIDQDLYEAATIDGAGRFKQMLHVTLPGIMPTIIILFILKMGSMMNVGFDKIFLLYNPITYETSDVISTYVYRKGILEANYSFSAAVGLFNSVINFVLLVATNQFSKKVNETSLW
ncbi:ABC transporter permease [Paenibacillus radicis (ex Xue et al. 2023)]|uniref:ABC transporter permease subunit n=1 Tax=Paenibacillus radicis (ex Xue et al. 2023) TaxID=2972489 RepID=A0ABT1YKU4_9BACL|nr:ABC transporter permease subunit [Paenibacillus radicis (ex Xue et al. 2023)]MCR8633029.1 ABC transporter permease subunit [Paenibacillus radicis (ex Xue et al. 2023)]